MTSKIAGYSIDSQIGAGGQAVVYLAVQESLQRLVALKVLNPVHAQSTEFTTRFINEGRILANLGHSNVITIHDIGVDQGLHYLSMEFVQGGDLRRRMRDGLAPQETLEYLAILADCLATASRATVARRRRAVRRRRGRAPGGHPIRGLRQRPATRHGRRRPAARRS